MKSESRDVPAGTHSRSLESIQFDAASGERLCQAVLKSLVEWEALDAVLQSGGLEVKGRGRLAAALQTWLGEQKSSLVVVPEYRRTELVKGKAKGWVIDLAIVKRPAATEPHLTVTSLVEVKSNYASQSSSRPRTARTRQGGEIGKRARNALAQARRYRRLTHAESAFVLYLVADPCCKNRPKKPRDPGYDYYRHCADSKPCMPHAIEAIKDAVGERRLLASAGSDLLHVCLLSTRR